MSTTDDFVTVKPINFNTKNKKILGGAGNVDVPGHTIVDASGNALPKRSKLKFVGAIVTDGASNNATVVN